MKVVTTTHLHTYTAIIQKVVAWYKVNHELFPWRTPHDGWQQHYRVWVSEIMLQQTTVQSVIPYFERFMEKFPSIQALANAPIDDVLTSWQGLGYYRRAHHLHHAAHTIMQEHHGEFPKDYVAMRALSGIGDYTAAAISAIAGHHPFVPVDGNVCRVFSRIFDLQLEADALLKYVKKDVASFKDYFIEAGYAPPTSSSPTEKQFFPSFFAQGLMDLGRTVCTPKNPNCMECPIQDMCLAFKKGAQHTLPLLKKKAISPMKYAHCWVVIKNNQIFLQKRTQKGLLSGLWFSPMTEFMAHPSALESILPKDRNVGSVCHVFSHFKLFVEISVINHDDHADSLTLPKEGLWVQISHLQDYALSTLMKKILKKASIV